MVPQSFEEWRNCIVNDCRIRLTKDFAKERLTVYTDKRHEETRKFVSLYGELHLQNIINWLRQV